MVHLCSIQNCSKYLHILSIAILWMISLFPQMNIGRYNNPKQTQEELNIQELLNPSRMSTVIYSLKYQGHINLWLQELNRV